MSPGSEYFILTHTKAENNVKTLTVVPPLPFEHPVYLSVTPRIAARFPNHDTYSRLCDLEQYQLDEASLGKFKQAIKYAGPSVLGIRDTCGEEEPALGWDTWSGQSPREAPGVMFLGRYVSLYFDLVPFENLSSRAPDPRIYEESALLRQ